MTQENTNGVVAWAVQDWDGKYVYVSLDEGTANAFAVQWEKDYAPDETYECFVVSLIAADELE